jgi:hypothetical protein
VVIYVIVFLFLHPQLTHYIAIMSKAKKTPDVPIKKTKGSGGEKIEFNDAAVAQKLYWEELVGNHKITDANCPESVSFDLHKLKAYLDEVESEFTRMKVPYGKRRISVMPIAYSETEQFSVLFTPSVPNANGLHQHQFNAPVKGKRTTSTLANARSASGSSNYDFQLSPLNLGEDNP